MDFYKRVNVIMNEFQKLSKCEFINKTGNKHYLKVVKECPKSFFMFDFIPNDGAKIIHIKMKWCYGEVSNPREVLKCLQMNGNSLFKYGPMSTSIITLKDKKNYLFFIGHLIFPFSINSEEIASILFNNSYLNYLMFDFDLPGVIAFSPKLDINNDTKNSDPKKDDTKSYNLNQIEPFNMYTVDNQNAALFTKFLSGRETFSIDAKLFPRSIGFYEINYNYPKLSSARGYLYTISIDEHDKLGNQMSYKELDNRYCIGELLIQYSESYPVHIKYSKLTKR